MSETITKADIEAKKAAFDSCHNVVNFGQGFTISQSRWVEEQFLRYVEHIRELEDFALSKGLMLYPPCFICGYDGPGYFHHENHPCAERHHKMYKSYKSGL